MGASAAEEPSQMRRALVDTLAGAISGGISRTVTSPLDVIKIRFQVRQNPIVSSCRRGRCSIGSRRPQIVVWSDGWGCWGEFWGWCYVRGGFALVLLSCGYEGVFFGAVRFYELCIWSIW
jgi:hypothetical protein